MAIEATELTTYNTNLYDLPSTHLEMLLDEKRVRSFQQGIRHSITKGGVVVDIGTGTGILAIFAANAGAEKVYAIDQQEKAINWAKRMAQLNNVTHKIEFILGDSLKIDLPEKADLVISEMIGHWGFEENIVDILYDAKKRFLKPQGFIIPQSITLLTAPVFENELYESIKRGWRNISKAYGLNFSPMLRAHFQEFHITNIYEQALMALPQEIAMVNFMENHFPESTVQRTYQIFRPGKVNGMGFWFQSHLTNNVDLSNGPYQHSHWKQVFAPLERPIEVREDDFVQTEIQLNLQPPEPTLQYQLCKQ